jgi:hypothetical protein
MTAAGRTMWKREQVKERTYTNGNRETVNADTRELTWGEEK